MIKKPIIFLATIASVFLLSLTACSNSQSSSNTVDKSSIIESSVDNGSNSSKNSETSNAESKDNSDSSNAESGAKSAGISNLYGMWVMDTGAGFKFNEDGTGSHFWLDKNDPNSISSETVFTYEATNDQVTLKYTESGFSPTYGYSIDGDTLTIIEHSTKRYYTRK